MTELKRAGTVDIVDRIRSRIHDAPMETERLLDDAADEIETLRRIVATIKDDPPITGREKSTI